MFFGLVKGYNLGSVQSVKEISSFDRTSIEEVIFMPGLNHLVLPECYKNKKYHVTKTPTIQPSYPIIASKI